MIEIYVDACCSDKGCGYGIVIAYNGGVILREHALLAHKSSKASAVAEQEATQRALKIAKWFGTEYPINIYNDNTATKLPNLPANIIYAQMCKSKNSFMAQADSLSRQVRGKTIPEYKLKADMVKLIMGGLKKSASPAEAKKNPTMDVCPMCLSAMPTTVTEPAALINPPDIDLSDSINSPDVDLSDSINSPDVDLSALSQKTEKIANIIRHRKPVTALKDAYKSKNVELMETLVGAFCDLPNVPYSVNTLAYAVQTLTEELGSINTNRKMDILYGMLLMQLHTRSGRGK